MDGAPSPGTRPLLPPGYCLPAGFPAKRGPQGLREIRGILALRGPRALEELEGILALRALGP